MHSKLRHKIVSLNSTKWKGINKICPFTYLETCRSYSCSLMLSESWEKSYKLSNRDDIVLHVSQTLYSVFDESHFFQLFYLSVAGVGTWFKWKKAKKTATIKPELCSYGSTQPSWFHVLDQTALNLSCSGWALFWGHICSWGVPRVLLFYCDKAGILFEKKRN